MRSEHQQSFLSDITKLLLGESVEKQQLDEAVNYEEMFNGVKAVLNALEDRSLSDQIEKNIKSYI